MRVAVINNAGGSSGARPVINVELHDALPDDAGSILYREDTVGIQEPGCTWNGTGFDAPSYTVARQVADPANLPPTFRTAALAPQQTGTVVALSDDAFTGDNPLSVADLWESGTTVNEARQFQCLLEFTWFGLPVPLTLEKRLELSWLAANLERTAVGYWNYTKADGSHLGDWNEGDGGAIRYRTGRGQHAGDAGGAGPNYGFTAGNANDLNLAAFSYFVASVNVQAGKQDDLNTARDDDDAGDMLTAFNAINSGWPSGT